MFKLIFVSCIVLSVAEPQSPQNWNGYHINRPSLQLKLPNNIGLQLSAPSRNYGPPTPSPGYGAPDTDIANLRNSLTTTQPELFENQPENTEESTEENEDSASARLTSRKSLKQIQQQRQLALLQVPQTQTGFVQVPQTQARLVQFPQTQTGFVQVPQTQASLVQIPQTQASVVQIPQPETNFLQTLTYYPALPQPQVYAKLQVEPASQVFARLQAQPIVGQYQTQQFVPAAQPLLSYAAAPLQSW